MSVKLKVIRGPRNGQTFEFDSDEITIGSGRTNDIVIMDNDVSPNHCRLLKIDRDYDIEDLKSKYGTFVSGQRISTEPFTMPPRAIIELGGQVTIEYEVVEAAAEEEITTGGIRMIESDPGSQPVLVHVDESNTIKEAYLLEDEELSLGRSTDNDIIIQEIDISRKHLKLEWRNNRYYAQDLNSRNGTFVNGERVKHPVELRHSDVIQLGATVRLFLRFRSDLPKDWRRTDRLDTRTTGQETTMYKLPAGPGATGTRELPMMMEQGELADSILVVYAREEWKDIVAAIVHNLNDTKQNVWVDQHLRLGTPEWEAATQQAKRECWLLVVVWSPAAAKSKYVREQYQYFYNREKPIIMVEYKPVENSKLMQSRVIRINYDASQPGAMYQRLLYEIMHLKPRYKK